MYLIYEEQIKQLLVLLIILDIGVTQDDYSSPRKFVLNLQELTWDEADIYCRDTGGHLAKIYDVSTIPDLNISQSLTADRLFWIGLSHDGSTGWKWSDNTMLAWGNWATSSDGLSPGTIACVVASATYPFSWHREECTKRLPSMCQYDGGECGFIEFANYSITGHNSQYLYDKSLEACKETCLTATNFFCVSFEYQQSGRLCQFNTGNRWTLLNFFAFYDGWTYYHRTCNTGVVITTNLTVSISSSIILQPSTSMYSTIYTPSSSVIACSPVYRDVNVTLTETSTVYSTVTLIHNFSVSTNDTADPVEELQEIEEVLKEKKKQRTKISYEDNRPSATYVGYVAIAFLSCVFGSIILFDLLTICRNTSERKHKKRTDSKKYDVLDASLNKTRHRRNISDQGNRSRVYLEGETEETDNSQVSEPRLAEVVDEIRLKDNTSRTFGLETLTRMETNNQKSAIPGLKQKQLWVKLWSFRNFKTKE